MQADPSAQRALLLIADLDTQTAQLRHRKATLPEHAKLAELAGKRGHLSEQVIASETRLGDAEAEQDRIESDLVPARARRHRCRGRQGAAVDDRRNHASVRSHQLAGGHPA